MVIDWLLKWGIPLKSARTVCAGGFSAYEGQVESMRLLRKAAEPYNREIELTGVPIECLGAVIAGGTGVGKTTMAAYALRLFAEKGLRAAAYIPFSQLLNRISEKRFTSLSAPLVLVIDDFNLNAGVEKFATSVMSILSMRAAKGRPTIIITSAPHAAAKQWAGGAFASWAAGNCVYAAVRGDDINKTIKQAQISKKLGGKKSGRAKAKTR